MTTDVRLLSTYKGFAPQSIISLPDAEATSLVSVGHASLTLTGGTRRYEDLAPLTNAAVYVPKGAQNVRQNQRFPVALPEGFALNVRGNSATGTVQRVDASGSILQTWSVSNTMAPIGPYSGTQQFLITCTAGSIDASVGDAVVGLSIRQIYGVPAGVDWLSDTLPNIDLYAIGFSAAPTIYFDPSASASSSKGLGTLNNPYYTEAQVEARCKGDMSGQVLGIKRGTTLRVAAGTGVGSGLTLNCYGKAGKPFKIVPYGQGALPIITAGQLRTDWAVDTGNIYKLTGITSNTDVWQTVGAAEQRLVKKSAKASLTAAGQAYYDSAATTLYIWPFDSADPNAAGIQISVADYALNVIYSDVAATGYVSVIGMDCRMARNISLRIGYPVGWTNIVSCAGLEIIGCRAGQAGFDSTNNSAWAADGMLMYGPGPTNAVYATNCMMIGCESYDCLNNAFETSNLDGFIQDGCYGHDCGGNVIQELWANMKNSIIRNNFGLRASNSGRLWTSYHCGGIWQAQYNNIAGGSTQKDHTSSVNNSYLFNVIAEVQTQGIELMGGTGHKVHHNTLYNSATTPTNRLLNFFCNGNVTGSASVDCSNNVLVVGNTGNRFMIDLVQGTVTTTDAGAVNIPSAGNLVATVTGDNNIYLNWASPSGQLRSRTSSDVQAAGQSTVSGYKSRVAPFDANCTAPFAPSNVASSFITSDYRPLSPIIGIGKTGLAYQIYKDGSPYNNAAATLGALGA